LDEERTAPGLSCRFALLRFSFCVHTARVKANRLDVEMVTRGLVESREQAQRFILAGEVWVEGQRWDKASKPCAAGLKLEVRGQDRYVGRGGHKLEGALTGFSLAVAGLRCLDLGASTGGFTDCLLQHGAREVVAVDVGHGQLHWRLRKDPRVINVEGANARDLAATAAEKFPGAFDLVVADVSFISLRLVLPPAFDLLHSGGRVVALIKPQFEAGREEVGRGGIVRDPAVRQRVIDGFLRWAEGFPLRSAGVIPSPLPGRDGNEEFLWLLQKN
jgi:23S rRNA (cytidine1920-2'-O)/16S rRNA (cytidine1409-2'-O)-methyltransferase